MSISAISSRRTPQQALQSAYHADSGSNAGNDDGFCLRNVANATGDPNLDAYSASDCAKNLQSSGRLDPNAQYLNPADVVLWSGTQGDPEGHAALATGRTAPDGSPELLTTTGASGMTGSQYLSEKQISKMIGDLNNGGPVSPAGSYTPQTVNG